MLIILCYQFVKFDALMLFIRVSVELCNAIKDPRIEAYKKFSQVMDAPVQDGIGSVHSALVEK